ncbi:hypothetical protein GF357_04050, partial [Candidatus Dojkabacteria bacterium]|nr:hypothetical protein [Candidatus Dojkabacteria bacterium]
MKKKMMLIIASVITIVLLSVGCDLNESDSNDTVTYNLREEGPAGGWVFYDKGSYSDGWRYMEAWKADESGTYAWKDQNTATPGTDTVIGTGYANTYTAMAGSNHPAAEAVREATYGGKTDWFVPSIYELEKIHENLYNGG